MPKSPETEDKGGYGPEEIGTPVKGDGENV